MSARDQFIADYVKAKGAAWCATNAIDPPHPTKPQQQPSPQHLATWADEAAQRADCPKD